MGPIQGGRFCNTHASNEELNKDDAIELRVSTPKTQPVSFRKTHVSGGSGSGTYPSDDEYLARLGKKSLLKREFGFMSMLGFSCSALLTWEGILVNAVVALLNGGPAGVVWGFLVNSWRFQGSSASALFLIALTRLSVGIGTMSVNACIAELASIAPTAAGQYHWVAMLAPESSRAFLSYMTAWLTTTAWQAMAGTMGYLIATVLQGIVILGQPQYEAKSWHTVLIAWAVSTFAVLVNSTTGRALARFEGIVLVLHLAGFFGVIIPLVYLAPHNEPSAVFSTFLNEGGWSSQALSFLVGFPSGASTLIGADCAVHMSEEIQSAAVVVPWAIMWTITINGTLGFAALIAMLFCLSDLEAALEASETMFYPFLEVFYAGVKSRGGAVAMALVILTLAIASSVGIYASASRMIWSFSRDKGIPFSKHVSKLSGKSSLPILAVLITLVCSMVLVLITLGSTVAFSVLVSQILAALYSSYLLSCSLLLWRRSTGGIQPYTDEGTVLDAGRIHWGPWKVPEPFGTINNVFAILYVAFTLFWSFWPQDTPTTPQNGNWSPLMFGSILIFSTLYYVFRARHYFKGPIKEV